MRAPDSSTVCHCSSRRTYTGLSADVSPVMALLAAMASFNVSGQELVVDDPRARRPVVLLAKTRPERRRHRQRRAELVDDVVWSVGTHPEGTEPGHEVTSGRSQDLRSCALGHRQLPRMTSSAGAP